MGDMYIELTIMNDSNFEKHRDIPFLVDTGATRAWIPQEVAAELGIQPVGQIPLELANGDIINYPYGLCKFEYEGELVNGTVIIGAKGIEPIAGTHVLQDFRLIIDLSRHTIQRARAMKAK
jgi:predicted aspartyl protease